jgi:hypothetical protein
MRRLITLAVVTLGLVVSAAPASADFLYTFEAPQFTFGQTTPLLNAAPNSGGGGFTTSFTPTGYQISDVASFNPNALMVGQYLYTPGSTAALHLAFSAPVTSLSLDFAINVFNVSPAGSLALTTSSGGTSVSGSNVGGTYQGGHLSFTSGTPFTSADLQGFFSPNNPTEIAIDNLSLTPVTTSPVPAPPAVVLVGLGAGCVALRRRFCQRAAA